MSERKKERGSGKQNQHATGYPAGQCNANRLWWETPLLIMVCVCAGCWRISMANWPCCVPAGNGLRVSRAGKDIIWFHTVWCAQWHAEWLLLLWNHTTNIQRMKPREIYQRKQNIYVSYVFCDLKLWMCCILDSFQMHRMYPGLCNPDFNKSFFSYF